MSNPKSMDVVSGSSDISAAALMRVSGRREEEEDKSFEQTMN
jgi:hypothetical protein